jgi:hypothetical protein
MTKPIVKIHNTETNEIVEREMTAAEFAQYKTDQAEKAAKKAELEAMAMQRQEILDRLGLTADEAKLILG